MRRGTITQSQRVLEYMQMYDSITQLEAMRDLGIMRLGARIWDLRKAGHKIKSETVGVKNRMGETVHVKRYSFRKDEAV